MSQIRVPSKEIIFTGSGAQSISVDAGEFINVFQIDVSITNDTTYEFKIGSTVFGSGSLIANATPIQMFFIGFGKGLGTGVKGDDLTITMGDAAKVYVTYIKHRDD